MVHQNASCWGGFLLVLPVWAKLLSGAEVKAGTFELSRTSENLRNSEIKFHWEVNLVKGKYLFPRNNITVQQYVL